MTGREKPHLPESATHWGVPGGGENTHSWRHREIVAAFESLEVTDAIALADKFEQIARWWADCVRVFEHAVNEALAQAWSGVGAAAAGSAVGAYVAQARDLTVALEELPEVVRAAAEAIVATKYAIPPLVADVGASTESAGTSGAGPAVGHSAAARSVRGVIRDVGSEITHGAASAAEETARSAMRQKYVTPFGELVGRIPLLPRTTRLFGVGGECGDRRLLVDSVGRASDERRARSTVGAADQSATAGRDGDSTGAPPAGSDRVMAGGVAQPGSSSAAASVATGANGGIASPGGAGVSVPSGAGSPTPWGNPAAAIDPATAAAGRSSPTSPYAGRSGSAAGDRTSGRGPLSQPAGQYDAQRPAVGHSMPGTTGSVIGVDPAAGHTSTRSVDRYFHCAGAPQVSPAPVEDAVRGLPAYLITAANTRELLGVPRPAITGGVIGGDELVPDQQRSSATRG